MPLRLGSPDNGGQNTQNSLLSPGWRQNRRSISSAPSQHPPGGPTAIRDGIINEVQKLNKNLMATIKKMTPTQRILAAIALTLVGVLGLLFLIFNEKIFRYLQPFAEKWKHTTGGWTILWALTFIAAFPPLIGYSTCGTLAGFVYGIPEGWLIMATATVAGSFCSFVVSRTILRKHAERLTASDKRFAALALTLKQDGLKLLCMIRLCPLPYSISNGAMSTFPTVEPHMYALATAIITPKLFIVVFIGDRLATIARTGEQMTLGTRVVNYLSIAVFAALGIFTGWFIYRKTMAKARELEAEEAQNVRNSVRRTGRVPGNFSDEPEAQAGAETTAQDDDDDVAYFDDAPSPKPPYADSGSDLDYFDDGPVSDTIGLQKK